MRASLWPISTAIESSAPCTTAAVIGSTLVRAAVTSVASLRQEQVPGAVGPRPPARRDDRRRVGMEDHGRAVERLVEREERAVVEARRQRSDLPVDAKLALAFVDERLAEAAVGDGKLAQRLPL